MNFKNISEKTEEIERQKRNRQKVEIIVKEFSTRTCLIVPWERLFSPLKIGNSRGSELNQRYLNFFLIDRKKIYFFYKLALFFDAKIV